MHKVITDKIEIKKSNIFFLGYLDNSVIFTGKDQIK